MTKKPNKVSVFDLIEALTKEISKVLEIREVRISFSRNLKDFRDTTSVTVFYINPNGVYDYNNFTVTFYDIEWTIEIMLAKCKAEAISVKYNGINMPNITAPIEI